MSDHPLRQLPAAFADLTDPRVDRTKEHLLLDILTLPNGIPSMPKHFKLALAGGSHDTLRL